MRSATAMSGEPSTLKSPIAVDQPSGLAALPSLKAGVVEAQTTSGVAAGAAVVLTTLPRGEVATSQAAGTSRASVRHARAMRGSVGGMRSGTGLIIEPSLLPP